MDSWYERSTQPTHCFVKSDEQGDLPSPEWLRYDLEGTEIHRIWRYEAFRNVIHSHNQTLIGLINHDYDFPGRLYERMKPALRLATLFMQSVMVDLAFICHSEVKERVSSAGFVDRFLYDFKPIDRLWLRPREGVWEQTLLQEQNLLQALEVSLVGLVDQYRFAVASCPVKDTGDSRAERRGPANSSLAFTNAVANEGPVPLFNTVFVQTAINPDWFAFLSREDWDILPPAEKYGKFFIMATTLVHELAHAIWIHRMVPLLELEYTQTGRLTVDQPEPKFLSQMAFLEYKVNANGQAASDKPEPEALTTVDIVRLARSAGGALTDGQNRYFTTFNEVNFAEAVCTHRGLLKIALPEPRYFRTSGPPELGYAIERKLFDGLPALSILGIQTPATPDAAAGAAGAAEDASLQENVHFTCSLTLIDLVGRAKATHQITTAAIYSFFNLDDWKERQAIKPHVPFGLSLVENRKPPRRSKSTVLSDPPRPGYGDVPTLRTPVPGSLRPAITEDNELVNSAP